MIAKADVKQLAEADENELVRDVQELYADYLAVGPHLFHLGLPSCSQGELSRPAAAGGAPPGSVLLPGRLCVGVVSVRALVDVWRLLPGDLLRQNCGSGVRNGGVFSGCQGQKMPTGRQSGTSYSDVTSGLRPSSCSVISLNAPFCLLCAIILYWNVPVIYVGDRAAGNVTCAAIPHIKRR